MATHTSETICGGCESKLLSAHKDIANWFRDKKKKYKNLHVSDAYRGQPEQNLAFFSGRSKLQWPNSKHNHVDPSGRPCSLALDVFQIDEDGESRWQWLFYQKLDQENKEARVPVRWGGEFKLLKDGPHFELITVQPTAPEAA